MPVLRSDSRSQRMVPTVSTILSEASASPARDEALVASRVVSVGFRKTSRLYILGKLDAYVIIVVASRTSDVATFELHKSDVMIVTVTYNHTRCDVTSVRSIL